jgi:SAM-dependent methyltransferase
MSSRDRSERSISSQLRSIIDSVRNRLSFNKKRALARYADFDPVFYLNANPDVAAAGLDPYAHYACHGQAEGRVRNALGDRLYFLRRNLGRSSKILEIGPACAPIAPKSENFNTFIVDNINKRELIEKYTGYGVDTTKIEDVDFIWKSGDLLNSVPEEHHKSFDVVYASDVIEHIPDPILFLKSLERLIRSDGVITLVVPDKRLCFDFYRPVTTTGAWIEARERGASIHSPKTRFEYNATVVFHRARNVWTLADSLPMSEFRFAAGTIHEAHSAAKNAMNPAAQYVDCHAWCFTPSSFALVIQECRALALFELAPDRESTQIGYEFVVELRLSDQPPIADSDRFRLMKMSADEQAAGFAMLC